MFSAKARFGLDPNIVLRTSKATFNAPLRWKEPRKVFVCSWSDFFMAQADKWRDDAYDVMRRAPQHTYQITTKRPEAFKDYWQPVPNAWLGVSVENQQTADERIPLLLDATATVRWVSVEPLLGPIDLSCVGTNDRSEWFNALEGRRLDDNGISAVAPAGVLNWVVVGGESGPCHREMNLDWLASIVDQCTRAGVPVWVKQDSGPKPGKRGRIPQSLWRQEWPR